MDQNDGTPIYTDGNEVSRLHTQIEALKKTLMQQPQAPGNEMESDPTDKKVLTATDNTSVRYGTALIGIPAAILAGIQLMSGEVNSTLMLAIIVVCLIGLALAFIKVDYIGKIADLLPFLKETKPASNAYADFSQGTTNNFV